MIRAELDELVRRESIPRPPGRDDWLAARAPFVGASECAALFGDHPFLTLGDLYAEKLGGPPQPETPAMRRGTFLEDGIARLWAFEHEAEVVEVEVLHVAIPIADELGVLCATLDREIVGAHEALEVKTSSQYVSEIPRSWYWQAQAQMLCSGLDRVRFAVLDASLDLGSFVVEPDYSDQAELLGRAREFFEHVRAREMPDGTFPSRKAIERLYPKPKRAEVELDGERVRPMLAKLARARRRQAEYRADADALAAMILFELGECTEGMLDGKLVVTGRMQHRTDIDTKRLRADHPELAAEYAKPISFRQVILK